MNKIIASWHSGQPLSLNYSICPQETGREAKRSPSRPPSIMKDIGRGACRELRSKSEPEILMLNTDR